MKTSRSVKILKRFILVALIVALVGGNDVFAKGFNAICSNAYQDQIVSTQYEWAVIVTGAPRDSVSFSYLQYDPTNPTAATVQTSSQYSAVDNLNEFSPPAIVRTASSNSLIATIYGSSADQAIAPPEAGLSKPGFALRVKTAKNTSGNQWTVPVVIKNKASSGSDTVYYYYMAFYINSTNQMQPITGFPTTVKSTTVTGGGTPYTETVTVSCDGATYPVIFAVTAFDSAGAEVTRALLEP